MASGDSYLIGEDTLREILRVLRKVEGMNFRGNIQFTNSPGGISGYIPGPGDGESNEEPAEIRRVKVVEANVATGPVVQLVNDPSVEGSSDAFPVVSLCKMATNDELYIFRPAGGVKDDPTYGDDDAPIVWRDCRLPGFYLADLAQDGGSRGSSSAAASWTYTVKLRGQTTNLTTTDSPEVRRHPFAADDADLGSIYIDDDGVVTLVEAYEPRVRGSC